MKSTYTARTGHERYKHSKKNGNGNVISRRKTALQNLEDQLVTKKKTNKEGEKEDLTENDVKRIQSEVATLRKRI